MLVGRLCELGVVVVIPIEFLLYSLEKVSVLLLDARNEFGLHHKLCTGYMFWSLARRMMATMPEMM